MVPCAIQAKKPGSSKKQESILSNGCVVSANFKQYFSKNIVKIVTQLPDTFAGNIPSIPGNINNHIHKA
jgi:hypothetical protein